MRTGTTVVDARVIRGFSIIQGVEVETSKYGKVKLSSPIHDKYKAVGEEVLGEPIASSAELPGGEQYCYFEKGMIVHRAANKTFAVTGYIYAQYRHQRDVFGFLGLPTADEAGVGGGGKLSTFDGGHIYYHTATGAFEVHGAILGRYLELGGPGGFLGYPLSEEIAVMSGRTEIGRLSRFQGGVIYWSAGTGAWEVHGDIRTKYELELGGPTGLLGFPLSNEMNSPGGSCRYNDFQKGILMWFGSYSNMRVIQDLEIYVDRIGSKGDDGFLGGDQDVYLIMDVSTSKGYHVRERLPGSGDFGSDAHINRTLPRFGVPTGDMTIRVFFEGWDSDSGFIRGWVGDDDDRLGTVDRTYTIDDLWGMNEDATHWAGDFMVVYKLRDITAYDPNQFRQNLFWNYDNFKTPKLSKSQYAQTFRDVDEDESVIWHPFNALYYELVYKGSADNGNCFGMCLESIYAQVCRSIYNEPIGRFAPTNGTEPQPGMHDEMINEINIKHGYQVGASFIDWFVVHFLSGSTHDPVQCFNESRNQFACGDFPIISLTRTYFGEGAHAVRPYRWDDSVKPWKIFIADPNRPWATNGNDLAEGNYIEVDPDRNTFKFKGASGKMYEGGTWTGGRMFSIPFSVLNSQPRTPFWEVLALLFGGTLLLIGGDAQTKQITDSHGNTFFEPNLDHLPNQWSDIRLDNSSRIPGMALLPIYHDLGGVFGRFDRGVLEAVRGFGLAPTGPQMFHLSEHTGKFRRPRPSDVVGGHLGTSVLIQDRRHILAEPSQPSMIEHVEMVHGTSLRELLTNDITHEIIGSGGTMKWGMHGPLTSAVISAPISGGMNEKVVLEQMSKEDQKVSYTPGEQKPVAMTMTRWSPHTQRTKLFEVTNLVATGGAKIKLELEDEGKTLRIQNEGAESKFDLVAQLGSSASARAERQQISLKQNEVVRITPNEWDQQSMPQTPISMKIFDAGGQTLVSEKQI